jgi:hypothetical protein
MANTYPEALMLAATTLGGVERLELKINFGASKSIK